MGDTGIDKWWWKMEEHKRKGHHIIEYGNVRNRKPINSTMLFLKEQRVLFWEKHRKIPKTTDLVLRKKDVETLNTETALMVS